MTKALRGAIAVMTLLAGTATTWAVGVPQAIAEPECMRGSNDFNGDGKVDVAIGLPGARNKAGNVEVRVTDGDKYAYHSLQIPRTSQAGDQFGASVAEIAYYHNEGEDNRCTQLIVGAPGRDVGGKKDAGALYLYAYNATEGEFDFVKEFVQGKDGVPGTPQAGANFGKALASLYHEPGALGPVLNPLYVGIPGYDVGGKADAGAFARLVIEGDGPAVTNGTLVTQDSAGVPGKAEAGDKLGSAVATADRSVLVGAPGENGASGGFLDWSAASGAELRFVTQDTAGVPGTAESGDRFGAAIYAALEAQLAGGGHNVLVGAPGEAIGSASGAGSTIVFTYNGTIELHRVKGFNQNTPGVAGTAEAGDGFGSSFGTWGAADFLVGVPGEDIGTVRNAGSVSALRGDRAWTQNTTGIPGVVEAGDRFGQTIGNARVPFNSDEDGVWLESPLIGVPGENGGTGIVLSSLPGQNITPENWTKYENAVPGDGYGQAIGKTN